MPNPTAKETLHKACKVHITEVSTGETRVIDEKINFEEGFPWVYMWEEGNFSCDCNRRLFFMRANGEEPDDSPCSDGKYRVKILHGDEVIYEDA